MGREVFRTIIVALVLCVVCSVLVSGAAVALREKQASNALLDKNKNILSVAGLADKSTVKPDEVKALFDARVQQVLVNLDNGKVVSESEQPYQEYDPREAAGVPALSAKIETDGPTPGVDRREKMAFVYKILVEGSESDVDQYVIPIYGKGLWSTLYGFLSVDSDGKTIRGITFYEHGETPGLGGEVENEKWQKSWTEKSAYGEDGEVIISVEKGTVDPSSDSAYHKIDGLSGATITSRGVSNFVQYWLGEDGFGPYLKKQTGA